MNEPIDTASTDTNIVPHTTTPTWEMELLVSGGTVFGLMQLTGLVDQTYISLAARASEEMNRSLLPLWMYIKFVLLTLIGTFIAHLCLRGYWVALVGMNSVYPGGIDWAKLRQGPISRDYSDRRVPPMSVLIEKADNLATRVFGVGFGFAMMMLIPIVIVSVSMACSFVLRHFFGVENSQWLFIGLFMVLFLPMVLAAAIDRRFGARLRPDGGPHRALMALFGFYDRAGLGRTNNILLTLFISRTGIRRWMGLTVVVIGAVFAVVGVQLATMKGDLELSDYVGLPNKALFSIASTPSSFYASERSAEPSITPLPYIADRIVSGPYLELFVPYRPRLHATMLRKHCPQALAATTDKNPRPALNCLAMLHAVQLDGKPIAIRFDASDDRLSGQRGMLAMIPVGALAPGRHELSLLEVHPDRDGPEVVVAGSKQKVAAPAAKIAPVTASSGSTDAIAELKTAALPAKPPVRPATKPDDQDPPNRYRIPFWK